MQDRLGHELHGNGGTLCQNHAMSAYGLPTAAYYISRTYTGRVARPISGNPAGTQGCAGAAVGSPARGLHGGCLREIL